MMHAVREGAGGGGRVRAAHLPDMHKKSICLFEVYAVDMTMVVLADAIFGPLEENDACFIDHGLIVID